MDTHRANINRCKHMQRQMQPPPLSHQTHPVTLSSVGGVVVANTGHSTARSQRMKSQNGSDMNTSPQRTTTTARAVEGGEEEKEEEEEGTAVVQATDNTSNNNNSSSSSSGGGGSKSSTGGTSNFNSGTSGTKSGSSSKRRRGRPQSRQTKHEEDSLSSSSSSDEDSQQSLLSVVRQSRTGMPTLPPSGPTERRLTAMMDSIQAASTSNAVNPNLVMTTQVKRDAEAQSRREVRFADDLSEEEMKVRQRARTI